MTTQAEQTYPLCWPAGFPRTSGRVSSSFKTSRERAVRNLMSELRRLGASDYQIILSTNIKTRKDGLPYADTAQPSDPGVAVYFKLRDNRRLVLACDKYRKVEENIHALGLTVEAMRGLSRWGASDMLDRVFTGFAALPAPEAPSHWTAVLGVAEGSSLQDVENAYRYKMRSAHPDAGGSTEAAIRINRAIEEARRELRA